MSGCRYPGAVWRHGRRVARGILVAGVLLALLGGLLVGTGCQGQQAKPKYPERPVTLIVPYAAGGPTDIMARTLAEALKKDFPQPINVVNVPGAAAVTGTNQVLTSAPDGYTIGIVANSALVNAFFATEPPYKPDDTLPPVCRAYILLNILAVRGDSPWQNLQDFAKYAREHPGQVRIANCGLGAAATTAAMLFVSRAGAQVTWVPFPGNAPALTALLGGNVEAAVLNPPECVPHVQSGKIRILGVFSDQRCPAFPDVPTAVEQGVDARWDCFEYIIVPKNTPQEVRDVLNASFKKALEDQNLRQTVEKLGVLVSYVPPQEAEKELRDMYKLMETLAQEIKLK